MKKAIICPALFIASAFAALGVDYSAPTSLAIS